MSENVEQNGQEAPKVSYNPLMDNVNEKPYSVQSISVPQEQLMGGIPEPSYQPQSISTRQNPYKQIRESGTMSGGSSDDGGEKSFNPSMNEMPNQEKKEGAKHMAKMVVDGYEQLHVFANMGLQFSPKKLTRLQSEGEIDLAIPIPDGYGNTITAGQFIQDYNEQSKDALTVSPAFKKEVTPILERVFAKRGAGLTDEQMLIYLFGKDIATKGVIFYQMKSTMGDMIEVIREQTQAYKDAYGQAPPPPPQPKQQSSRVNTEPNGTTTYKTPSDYVATNAADFNFQTNETVIASSVEKLEVPKSGKARIIEQKNKEKKWKEATSKGNSSYEQALEQRKTGKRGRKKSVVDYINSVDVEDITDALILTETNKDEIKPNEE
jgi:hypothetical protein